MSVASLTGSPNIELGELVRALVYMVDEGKVVANPGDIGHVVHKEPGHDPTVHWEKSGRLYDTSPTEEMEVIRISQGSGMIWPSTVGAK